MNIIIIITIPDSNLNNLNLNFVLKLNLKFKDVRELIERINKSETKCYSQSLLIV